jgi:hypothetical protein
MLIDILMVGGTSAACAVAAGGIGLVLSRKFWRRPEVVLQSEPELVAGETSIAAAPSASQARSSKLRPLAA